jgi:hypothetical protein
MIIINTGALPFACKITADWTDSLLLEPRPLNKNDKQSQILLTFVAGLEVESLNLWHTYVVYENAT